MTSGESLDEAYDVARPLLPAEVIGIIDQLLCLEVSVPAGNEPPRPRQCLCLCLC